ESVRATYPDATINTFRPSIDGNRSAEVGIEDAAGRSLDVFVNPYTGEVLGERDLAKDIPAIAREIHRSVWMGSTGRIITELAACRAPVLVITGPSPWVPRKRSAIWGAFLPRFRARGRTRWRDLHAVTGFYG